MRPRRIPIVALAWAMLGGGLASAWAQDGASPAEQKLRVARRLAADGSPEAAAAYARLVADHPQDALADDALVEHAVWLGAPAWPEDLSGLPDDRAPAAHDLLTAAARAGGDRRHEALHRLALLQIASGAGRKSGERGDLARLRPRLLEVATARGASPWSEAARYAAAWIDEGTGALERARSAYQRLVVDEPNSEAGRRAQVGLARALLRRGEPGLAAAWLQQAVASGARAELGAEDLRELAVRTLLRSSSPASRWAGSAPRRWASGVRGATAIARVPRLGTIIVDRRGGVVAVFDRDGKQGANWLLDDVRAVAVDPIGRIYAAAGETLHRLAAGGRALAMAPLGEFAEASALAADASGRVFVVDRRGDRIGWVEPGAAPPVVLRERRGAGFAAIASDGARLLVGEGKTGRVLEIGSDGRERPVIEAGVGSAAAIAVDAAGTIAVLDTRADAVVVFGPHGKPVDRFAYGEAGFGRVAGLAFGRGGDLQLLEGSTGDVLGLP